MINQRIHNNKLIGTSTVYSAVVPVRGNEKFWTLVENITIGSLVDKTAAQGTAPSLTVEGIVFTAKDTYRYASADNTISIALTGGGTAGAETVTVTGTGTVGDPFAIDIAIESGVSTRAQVLTALTGSAPASAIITGSAAVPGGAVNAAVAALLTGGADTVFDLSAETITIATHGFDTGQHVALTTSSGSLPAGLSADMYVIKVNASTIKLATSYANAVAGTNVNITDLGDQGATLTLDPGAAVVGTAVLQGSLDGTNYFDLLTAFNITSTAVTTKYNTTQQAVNYLRVKYALTEGIVYSTSHLKMVE